MLSSSEQACCKDASCSTLPFRLRHMFFEGFSLSSHRKPKLSNCYYKSGYIYAYTRAGVAQSVYWLTKDWTTGRSGFHSRQRQRIFPLVSVFRPALGPTHHTIQWVPGVLSPGLKRGRGVTLTTQPHLVQRSRMSRSYIFSPPWHLHCVAGHL
jgi:hypothetical protein